MNHTNKYLQNLNLPVLLGRAPGVKKLTPVDLMIRGAYEQLHPAEEKINAIKSQKLLFDSHIRMLSVAARRCKILDVPAPRSMLLKFDLIRKGRQISNNGELESFERDTWIPNSETSEFNLLNKISRETQLGKVKNFTYIYSDKNVLKLFKEMYADNLPADFDNRLLVSLKKEFFFQLCSLMQGLVSDMSYDED